MKISMEGWLSLQMLWGKHKDYDHVVSFKHRFKDMHFFTNENGVEVIACDRHMNGNLAELAELILGQKISKNEQVSKRAHRPLTKSQRNYAETDVIIVLDIYDELHNNLVDKTEFETHDIYYQHCELVKYDAVLKRVKRKESKKDARNNDNEQSYIKLEYRIKWWNSKTPSWLPRKSTQKFITLPF